MPQFNHGSQLGIFQYDGPDVFLKRKELLNKGEFVCSLCGKKSFLTFIGVLRNPSSKCSRCSEILVKFGSKFGDLIYEGDDIWIAPKSDKILKFKCLCGKQKNIVFKSVYKGLSKSCGECSVIMLKHSDCFGDLTYNGPDINIHCGSHQKLPFICKCGKNCFIRSRYVFSKGRRNCGRCSEFFLENGAEYFEFIYVGNSIYISPRSARKLLFKCKCGQTKLIGIQHITSGSTKSCGKCFTKAKYWYDNHKDQIKLLTPPLDNNEFPSGGPVFISPIVNSVSPIPAFCMICNKVYHPRLRDIKRGVSLTCGCSNYNISKLNKDMSKFVSSLGFDIEEEYELDGRKFNIFVNHKKTLIEMNGLHWHSFSHSKKLDLEKYEIARRHGHSLISIYEDEWLRQNNIIKDIITSRLGVHSPKIQLRPQECKIEKISFDLSCSFYKSFHYIGPCRSSFHFGVFFNDLLVACMSFGKPSRQTSSYNFELTRMASHFDYRVHGIWSKILKKFTNSYRNISIVSFSDNRLFSGNVYKSIGFKYDRDIPPDYYWVKGTRRYHKSGLRLNGKIPGLTETKLREAEGYKKIWDLGKKRWILNV